MLLLQALRGGRGFVATSASSHARGEGEMLHIVPWVTQSVSPSRPLESSTAMARCRATTAHPGHHSQARPTTPPGSPGQGVQAPRGKDGGPQKHSSVGPQSWTGHRGQPQGTDFLGLSEGCWGMGLGWTWHKAWSRGTYPGDILFRELTCDFHCPLCPQCPTRGGL